MAIDLYKHNAEAYEAALSMLAETGKAAIVHPTGTGKSFIGFKLCEDSPNATVCWLSPSEYIFKTQIENLIASGADEPQNIKFYTYAKLMNMSDDEIAEIQPDILIFDEYHRAGAPQWQNGVKRLMQCYPNAPILGLSATNIRYLDNQRDMADELFDGNIASEMTLGEAIVRGILKAPKYVMAIYSYKQEFEKYRDRITKLQSRRVRDEAEKVFEALRRALEKADGLDDIFDKHMTDRTGKYILFTSNIEAMRECMDKAHVWFAKVDRKPHIYSVYSADPSASVSFEAFKEDDDTTHLRLLFCIDALNEGIHVDDVSGVILFRPTISPIIYKQQVGRALSADKKREPIIFDIVNNFENLYSIGMIEEEMQAAITYYRYFGEENEVITEQFKIIDEVRDCRRLFDELEGTLSASWDLMYGEAKKYYKAYGNLDVPKRHKTIEGYSLGAWLMTQRQVRAGEQVGYLDETRIAKLDAIGMRWTSVNDVSWEKHYQAYKDYIENSGTPVVPGDYVTEDHILLGRWLKQIRACRKSGIKSNYLTPERIEQLSALGMVWDQPDYLWERNYAAAVEYHREHGNLEVPVGYIQDGIKLYNWMSSLRKSYRGYTKSKNAPLSEEQIARLDALDMRWLSKDELLWEEGFEEAKRYSMEHGAADAPYAYVTKSGYKLGIWLSKCREKYAKGSLSDEQIARLESVHMVWSKSRANTWDACYALLRAYYTEHGDILVPPDYKADGIWLNKWLNEQKQILLGKRKNKTLTEEQTEKLKAIGFSVEDRNEARWNQNYGCLKSFYEKNGHIKLPVGSRNASGESLYNWLNNQRIHYRQGKLSERRIEMLEQVGFFGV